MIRLLALSLLLAGGVAQAQPSDPVCTDLTRLDEAAGRTGSFRSVMAEGIRPRFLRVCTLSAAGMTCTQNLTPRHLTPAAMAERMRRCLPAVRVSTDRLPHGDTETVVRTRHLRLRLSDRCTERCRAGRIMTIYAEIPPRTGRRRGGGR